MKHEIKLFSCGIAAACCVINEEKRRVFILVTKENTLYLIEMVDEVVAEKDEIMEEEVKNP